MRYLIIAPSYFPLENPRAYRWTVKVKELLNQGHDVTVITANDGLTNTSTRIEDILRVGHSSPDKRWTEKKTADRKSFTVVKKMAQLWMWPDQSMFWIKPAFIKAKNLFASNKFDVVISVSHPFSSHIVAYKLKKKFSFQWMIDIGDPFVHHDLAPRNNSWLYSRKNKGAEEKVFNLCDEIWVTNPALQKLYQRQYPSTESKIKVYGPVASPIPTQAPTPLNLDDDVCHVGYFGTFYDGVRPLYGLNSLVSHFPEEQKIAYHFYGSIKNHHKDEIRDILHLYDVDFHPSVARSNVIAVMNKMDYLLSVGNLSSIQLPSKVVDYQLAERPIIHIQYIENDACLDFWSTSAPISDLIRLRPN